MRAGHGRLDSDYWQAPAQEGTPQAGMHTGVFSGPLEQTCAPAAQFAQLATQVGPH